MSLVCPKCGSRFLRESRRRSPREKLQRLWFVAPLRCLDCETRFVTSTMALSDIGFARCPQCDRMDLNGWTGKSYTPPFWMALKITLGATRFRCEYCRINFASFRKRKEFFTFKRWERMNSGQARAEGRARVTELRAQHDEPSLSADLTAKRESESGLEE